MKQKQITSEAHGRLVALLDYLVTNTNDFSKEIGLPSPQGLYDLGRGKIKSISPGLAYKINRRYPEINIQWLLGASEDMIVDAEAETP